MNLLTNTLPEGGVQATLLEAMLYAVMGYLVVFAGIAFLILVVWLVGKLMSKADVMGIQIKKVKSKFHFLKARKEKEASEAVPAPAAILEETEEVDEETVAVIMAALMAYYEKNDPKCEFTIKRIKKVRRNDYA